MSLKKLIPIRSSESAPLRTKYGLLEWTILEPNTRSCLRKKVLFKDLVTEKR